MPCLSLLLQRRRSLWRLSQTASVFQQSQTCKHGQTAPSANNKPVQPSPNAVPCTVQSVQSGYLHRDSSTSHMHLTLSTWHTYLLGCLNTSSMDCIPLTACRPSVNLQTKPSVRVDRLHCTLYTRRPVGIWKLGSRLKKGACASLRGCSWVGGDPPGSTSSAWESGTVVTSTELGSLDMLLALPCSRQMWAGLHSQYSHHYDLFASSLKKSLVQSSLAQFGIYDDMSSRCIIEQ